MTRINLVLEQEIKKKKSESLANNSADTVESILMKSQMPDVSMDALIKDLMGKLLDTIEILRDSML